MQPIQVDHIHRCWVNQQLRSVAAYEDIMSKRRNLKGQDLVCQEAVYNLLKTLHLRRTGSTELPSDGPSTEVDPDWVSPYLAESSELRALAIRGIDLWDELDQVSEKISEARTYRRAMAAKICDRLEEKFDESTTQRQLFRIRLMNGVLVLRLESWSRQFCGTIVGRKAMKSHKFFVGC